MALQATPYKVEINLSDMDRNRYDTLRFTMARHPSETHERLLVRLLARILWDANDIEFGRGLSNVDEPALWLKSLDGRVLHWIEVGLPDHDRLVWCSRRAEKVSVFAYATNKTWLTKTVENARDISNLTIVSVSSEALAPIAENLTRSINLSIMLSENTFYITDDQAQHTVELEWLIGEREA